MNAKDILSKYTSEDHDMDIANGDYSQLERVIDDALSKIQKDYTELLRVSDQLINFIEDNDVEDDFDAEEGDTWRSPAFQSVITEAQTVISQQTEGK